MAQNPYQDLVEQIVQTQATILGLPVAVRRARNVTGLVIDDQGKVSQMPSSSSETLEALVNQYKILSGNMGVQFCKQAASAWSASHPAEKIPAILQ